MNLREFARGKPCQIRLVGICNFQSETTVLAHFRLISLPGYAGKPPDFIGAHACSACHAWVDTHKDADTQLCFAHGVMRTQALILESLELGYVQLSKSSLLRSLAGP